MNNQKALDLLRTAIGELSYLKPCNLPLDDYEYVVRADNALRELRELLKGDGND